MSSTTVSSKPANPSLDSSWTTHLEVQRKEWLQKAGELSAGNQDGFRLAITEVFKHCQAALDKAPAQLKSAHMLKAFGDLMLKKAQGISQSIFGRYQAFESDKKVVMANLNSLNSRISAASVNFAPLAASSKVKFSTITGKYENEINITALDPKDLYEKMADVDCMRFSFEECHVANMTAWEQTCEEFSGGLAGEFCTKQKIKTQEILEFIATPLSNPL